MKKNIPISDQWKLEGECSKCRRANYCGRDCSASKRRKTKIAQQAYFDFMEEMEADAKRILNEGNIVFNKYYWKQTDKLATCKKENIDIMIDDDYKIIEKLSTNGVKTLYFRDTNLKRLVENDYVKEVNNWGDVCRYFSSFENN